MRGITLRELAEGFDINCPVEIYDCTSTDVDPLTWDELGYPVVDSIGIDVSAISDYDPALLSATVRYMTINAATQAIVIEVVL